MTTYNFGGTIPKEFTIALHVSCGFRTAEFIRIPKTSVLNKQKDDTMKLKKIILWTTGVLTALFAVLFITLLIANRSGRTSLLKNASSRMPRFSEELDQPLPDEEWQEDWIRYQGKVYDYNENILTFLCMGIDVDDVLSEQQQGWDSGQADALFLLVLNPDTKKMTIIAIDRNTMTDVDMYDRENNFLGTAQAQVNLAHGYGDGREGSAQNQVKAVSRLMYELPIHGYCAINLPAIYILNDTIGGVDVTILEDFTSEYFPFSPGETVHLDGRLAYFYIRYRDVDVGESARMRLGRQKQYLLAFVEKAKQEFAKDVTLPLRLFNAAAPSMVTDLTADEVVYLAVEAAGYTFSEDDLIILPGFTDTSGEFDEFYADQDALKQIIIDVFYTEVEGI